MKKLRLLRVDCATNCEHVNYLSNELRLFHWYGCPLRSLPPSFQPHNLVALFLRSSRIEQLWQGTVRMDKLKRIDLSWSQYLTKTPDFTEAPNLEVLKLEGCTRLVDIHPSVAVHKRVKFLNFKGCTSLRSLPTKIGMDSLEKLTLSGCSNLERFPEIDEKMERLLELDLSGSYKIENLREMLGQAPVLSSLEVLKLRNCDLGEGDIPTEIGCLSSLEILDLSKNNFISIPSSLTRLSKLHSVDLLNCSELKSLPELPTTVTRLNINGCTSLERIAIAIPSKACSNSFEWVNCYRLVENMDTVTWLKKHLKVFANSREGFGIIMPGSEIPEWFSQERVKSSSIKIPLPLNIRNDSQWMGVALFCIFANHRGGCPIGTPPAEFYFQAKACYRNSGQAGSYDGKFRVDFGKHKIGIIKKDHIFLRYLSRARLSTSIEIFGQECDELELSFRQARFLYVKVKQCGFRMVYQKDLEDIQLIEEQQYNNQSSAESEDIRMKMGSTANGSRVKRKRNVS